MALKERTGSSTSAINKYLLGEKQVRQLLIKLQRPFPSAELAAKRCFFAVTRPNRQNYFVHNFVVTCSLIVLSLFNDTISLQLHFDARTTDQFVLDPKLYQLLSPTYNCTLILQCENVRFHIDPIAHVTHDLTAIDGFVMNKALRIAAVCGVIRFSWKVMCIVNMQMLDVTCCMDGERVITIFSHPRKIHVNEADLTVPSNIHPPTFSLLCRSHSRSIS